MKRLTAIIAILLLIALLPVLPSCQRAESEKISIVCTLFPQYDWIKNIVKDSESVEVSLLIQNGTDPHSYQPTAADILTISNCDMIVYIGGESDVWVQEALERAKAESIVKVALSEIEEMTLREISSSSHSHDEHDHHDHDHGHGVFDEHLWLSLSNASVALNELTEQICQLDPKCAEEYRKNSAEYAKKLSELDNEYRTAVESVAPTERFVLFADRFPFVYLLSDYSVDYSAAFEGCTTDVDAGFDTVLRLIKEADSHGIGYIAVTETSDGQLAETVAASAKKDIEILRFNSLQSITASQLEGGVSYLGVMRENLETLKIAIGAKQGE